MQKRNANAETNGIRTKNNMSCSLRWGDIKIAIQLHYFARFKCPMDTDRNHHKANFINTARRTMFLHQKTVKQVLHNSLNEKIQPMFDDHPFACLGLIKALSIDFVWEFK